MVTKLQKDGPIPLYFQMKETLKKEIETGILEPGDVLPSENNLISQYEVSRTTVRQAVNELVLEGYLLRKRGVGTFVAKPKHSQWELESLSSFAEELNKKGISSTTKMLNMQIVKLNIELKSIFGDQFSTFYCLERLRYVEEQPAVVVTTYVPEELAPGLDKFDMSVNSLYDILLNTYMLDIEQANRTFLATIVEENDAELLNINQNSAIQLVRTRAYLRNGTPFEYSISRNRGDLSVFKVELKYKK